MESEEGVRSAGGLLLTDDGGSKHIALVRKQSGTWVLPKGHCEGDETLERAAIREVAEETGLQPEHLRITHYLGGWCFNEHDHSRHSLKTNHFFLMNLMGGGRPPLAPDEAHAGAAWHPVPLRNVQMEYDYQRELVQRVAAEL